MAKTDSASPETPARDTSVLSIDLDHELHARLKIEAIKQKTTLSGLVRQMLSTGVQAAEAERASV